MVTGFDLARILRTIFSLFSTVGVTSTRNSTFSPRTRTMNLPLCGLRCSEISRLEMILILEMMALFDFSGMKYAD